MLANLPLTKSYRAQSLMNPFFLLPPELAHKVALGGLDWLYKLAPFVLSKIALPKTPQQKHMGLAFVNPFGIAAGLDKNAQHIDSLHSLGFGFLEVGTVTPLPQAGNPQPRLFRLFPEQAILNRMGFNNLGLEALVQQVKSRESKGILGINIGKNKQTPLAESWKDYVLCLKRVYTLADYIVINISSPNTPHLRDLFAEQALGELLGKIFASKQKLQSLHEKEVPIVLKLPPDIEKDQLPQLFRLIQDFPIAGLIITNTTVSRAGITKSTAFIDQAGGISGAPLRQASLEMLKEASEYFQGSMTLIASGGVMNLQDIEDKFEAGADLIQLYSGLIFRPLGLIREAKSYCLQSALPLE